MRGRWVVLIVAIVVVLIVLSIPVWSALNSLSFYKAREDSATFTSYNPYNGGGTWYKGQLHCHSTASDGELSPSEVVARYAALGYQFIALSDHDTVTKVNGESILVLGQEYGKGSTESGSGHMTHMGGINVSYAPSISTSEQQRIDSITSQGGIAILNHPTAPFYAYNMEALLTLNNYTGLDGWSQGLDTHDNLSMIVSWFITNTWMTQIYLDLGSPVF